MSKPKEPSLLTTQLDCDDRDNRGMGVRSSEGYKMQMRRVIGPCLRDRWLKGKCEPFLSVCQLFSCGRHVWPADGTERVDESSASEARKARRRRKWTRMDVCRLLGESRM